MSIFKNEKERIQFIYEKIRAHAQTMTDWSLTEGAETPCSYRSPDGNKCLVGCLIDDSNYSPDLEGVAASYEWVLDAVSKSLGFPDGIDQNSATAAFLTDCQRVHDMLSLIGEGRKKAPFNKDALIKGIDDVASEFDLELVGD